MSVATALICASSLDAERLEVAVEARVFAVVGDVLHRRALQVADQRQVLVALSSCLLVDADQLGHPARFRA